MTGDEGESGSDNPATDKQVVQPVIYGGPVPTIYCDGVVGSAHFNGLHRIILGEAVFNPTPGASVPMHRPVINLVMTPAAIHQMIAYLGTLEGVLPDAEA